MGATHAVLSIEGLLAGNVKPGDSFVASQPQRDGLMLYIALLRTHRLVLSHNQEDEDKAAHWVASQGLRDHVHLLGRPDDWAHEWDDWMVRVRQLTTIRNLYGEVELWATTDPVAGARILREGVPVLLYNRPAYYRDEHRPDVGKSLRSWSAIEDEVTAQNLLRAKDRRLHEEADGRFE